MSLLKYLDESVGRARESTLHFGRASLDGVPYRGRPVTLREEEYDELTEVTYDANVRVFEITKEEDRKEFQTIIDKHVNGWYVLHENKHQMVEQADGTIKVFVYCVWSQVQRELNQSRAAMISPLS